MIRQLTQGALKLAWHWPSSGSWYVESKTKDRASFRGYDANSRLMKELNKEITVLPRSAPPRPKLKEV
jgi:hypothetical protein